MVLRILYQGAVPLALNTNESREISGLTVVHRTIPSLLEWIKGGVQYRRASALPLPCYINGHCLLKLHGGCGGRQYCAGYQMKEMKTLMGSSLLRL